ncbi:MAG: hypothetical protein KAH14_01365, partial [Clostridiales bacterium]|nr:hypothetical protein [Clostridiales bacterium]
MISRTFFSKRNLLILSVLIAVVAISLILILSGHPPKKPDGISAGDYSYAVDYAEYQIEKTMRKNNIPGVVFALIDGEDIIISKAFGFADIENR